MRNRHFGQNTLNFWLQTEHFVFIWFLLLFVVQNISDRLHSVIYDPKEMGWFMSIGGCILDSSIWAVFPVSTL